MELAKKSFFSVVLSLASAFVMAEEIDLGFRDSRTITSYNVTIKPEVVLIPFGEIKTSYSGEKSEIDSVFMLRRGINHAQLQSRPVDDFVPVSTQQTVNTIQFYIANLVASKLSDCNVPSELFGQEAVIQNSPSDNKSLDYLYQVQLGISRLVVSQSLFSTNLKGEAEAIIIENGKPTKKILVDSFGGGKEPLLNYGSDEVESDKELKVATSRVVDFFANKLGDKLCRYFN